MPPKAGPLKVGPLQVGPVHVGDDAPDFELAAVTGAQRHTFKLASFRGKKNVVLAFYALDWSPT